ncbi:MAG: sugar kinase [Halobacteriovoraceae bacterium]|nr:sugar kinase [Halobacteriovoraceae bacterium]
MVSSYKFIMGIDVGGTKIEGVLLALKKDPEFEIIERKRIPTLRKKGYSSVLTRITELIEGLVHQLPHKSRSLSGIGVGLPGTVDPESQLMLNGNTSLFVGQSLKYDLKKTLRNEALPILIENDANCFTLAETKMGAGLLYEKGVGIPWKEQISIGIILGTGVGGGLVHQGQIFRGRKGGGLEVGHGPLGSRLEGRPCFCGLRGCAETYLSGTALIEDFKRESHGLLPEGVDPGSFIFEQSEDKSSIFYKIVSNYKRNLSLFLVNLTNIFDPDYFVLGGGVSKQLSLYQGLEKDIIAKSFVPESSPKVYQHKLGDSAGVLGAAFLIKSLLDSNKNQAQQLL